MLRLRVVILALLLIPFAQAGSEISVAPLFPQKALSPNVWIPFRVKGLDQIRLESVNLASPAALNCNAVNDPFHQDIFLLKCGQSGSVHLEIRLASSGGKYLIAFGPLEIKPSQSDGPIPLPTDPEEQLRFRGNQLFNAYCVRCHSEPSAKANRSASQIDSAIHTIPDMLADANDPQNQRIDIGDLTPTDLDALAAYLGGPL